MRHSKAGDFTCPTAKDLRAASGDYFLQEVMEKGKVLYARPDERVG